MGIAPQLMMFVNEGDEITSECRLDDVVCFVECSTDRPSPVSICDDARFHYCPLRQLSFLTPDSNCQWNSVKLSLRMETVNSVVSHSTPETRIWYFSKASLLITSGLFHATSLAPISPISWCFTPSKGTI
jgi:hypothetical protein